MGLLIDDVKAIHLCLVRYRLDYEKRYHYHTALISTAHDPNESIYQV